MYYEIKAFNKVTGSALVRFWADDYPTGLLYNIDIPTEDGAYIFGAALDAHIRSFSPDGQIARLVMLAALDTTALESLVVSPEPQAPTPEKTPAQIKVEQINAINKIKADKLAGGFVFNGTAYPCDGVFQQQVAAFMVAWREGILSTEGVVAIRTYDDQIVGLGQAEVKALATALLTYVQSVYAASWAAKDALV